MPKDKLKFEQRFIRNLLIGFFTALFIVFVLAVITLFQTLITFPSTPKLNNDTIQSCFAGKTDNHKSKQTCLY